MPQALETKQILQHGPRRAALMRHASDHAAYENFQVASQLLARYANIQT